MIKPEDKWLYGELLELTKQTDKFVELIQKYPAQEIVNRLPTEDLMEQRLQILDEWEFWFYTDDDEHAGEFLIRLGLRDVNAIHTDGIAGNIYSLLQDLNDYFFPQHFKGVGYNVINNVGAKNRIKFLIEEVEELHIQLNSAS
jgi:hypothetical protein